MMLMPRKPEPATKKRLTLDQYPGRMRVDQVAEYLCCCANQVRAMIDEGLLEALPLNPHSERRHWRVNRDSVAAYEKKFSSHEYQP